jgi:hypothetical protein
MSLLLSHRIDRILDHLALRLDRSPFVRCWILLPSLINKQWFMVELIARIPERALCGVQFMSWREALGRVTAMPDLQTMACAVASYEQRQEILWPLSRNLLEAEWYDQDYDFNGMPQLDQIHCVCIDEMPPAAWGCLHRLTKQLSIYLFSPCRMFWEDLCTDRQRNWFLERNSSEDFERLIRDTHPLLANWGVIARSALKAVQHFDVVEDYSESEGESLLHAIRRDLLNLRTLEEGVTPLLPDDSLHYIAAGASPLQEVEILKQNVIRFLTRGGIAYSDLLILAPNMDSYAPLLQMVFSDELPLRMSLSRKTARMTHFFALIADGWDPDDLIAYLENEFSREEMHLIRAWMKEARIWDGWEEALERMQLGLVFLLPSDEGPARISTIDWSCAACLLRFLREVYRLRQFRLEEDRTLREWVVLLKEIASAEEDDVWRTFLHQLLSSSLSFPIALVPFAWIHSAWKEHLRSAQEGIGTFFVDAIQCNSLSSGSVRPARAIFMIGMDREHFPRYEEPTLHNWPSWGPSSADRDRSLMLQVLFAARDQLTVSYCHLSAEDGQPVEVALPIQELMDVLDRYYGLKNIQTTPKVSHDTSFPSQPWPQIPCLKKPKRWHLADLSLLARNPWRYFVHKTLIQFPKKEPLLAELLCKDSSFGAFGEWKRVQQQKQESLWNTHFTQWGIDPENVQTLHIQGEFVGAVERALPGALFLTTDLTLPALIRHWPSFLAVSTLATEAPKMYSLKTGKCKVFEALDVQKEFQHWQDYAIRALESPSPLIHCWVEDFLKRGKETWKKNAEESVLLEEDEAIRWILSHYVPIPLDRIWEEWSAYLQELVHALL